MKNSLTRNSLTVLTLVLLVLTGIMLLFVSGRSWATAGRPGSLPPPTQQPSSVP